MNLATLIPLIREMVREETVKPDSSAESSTVQEQSARRASRLSARREGFARLAALREQDNAIIAKQKEFDREGDRLVQEQAALNKKHQHFQERQAQLNGERLANSFGMDRAQAMISITCSPLVGQFLTRIGAELERLGKLEPQEQISFGEKNLLADVVKTPRYTHSNAPAIQCRTLALFAARDRAHELELSDSTDEQLQMEIEGIWNNLPTIDHLEQVMA